MTQAKFDRKSNFVLCKANAGTARGNDTVQGSIAVYALAGQCMRLKTWQDWLFEVRAS
jgi:hypothetical protein